MKKWYVFSSFKKCISRRLGFKFLGVNVKSWAQRGRNFEKIVFLSSKKNKIVKFHEESGGFSSGMGIKSNVNVSKLSIFHPWGRATALLAPLPLGCATTRCDAFSAWFLWDVIIMWIEKVMLFSQSIVRVGKVQCS